MTARWLVTGGAGYIGAHTVRALRRRGDEVVVLDDLSSGVADRLPAEVPLAEGSVLDADHVAAVLADHRVDGVLHFAARKSVPESVAHPLYYYRENVEGLRAVLGAMADVGVERIVYSSSAAVYGATAAGAVDEDAPCVPVNPYGTSKLVGEWMLADQHRATGLRYAALRYFNVAGAHDALLADRGRGNLVPIALDAVARGLRPPVFGADYDTPDGSCVRDYVHVDDLADAHVAATNLLEHPGAAETLNIGVGRGFSVLEVLAAIAEATGRPVEPEIVARRAGDPASVVADVTRARERLGWTARHGLPEIVASAWAARAGHAGPAGA